MALKIYDLAQYSLSIRKIEIVVFILLKNIFAPYKDRKTGMINLYIDPCKSLYIN